ncbi:TPA: glycosyltransferase [Vibrio parahaemolyticus]
MNKPLVSVISVTYNSDKTIEDAIKSLRLQSYENFEHIVIDGNSTDDTKDILDSYKEGFSYYISEPDKGISDAWNKGITAARGELIVFLNSDDMFHPDTLKLAVEEYIASDQKTVIYGKCCFFNESGIESINSKVFTPKRLGRGLGFGFVHTTCFVPKSIYDKVGLFNLNYKIAIDTEFLVRVYLEGYSFQKGTHQVYMREGGVSDAYSKRAYFEYLSVLKKYALITSQKERNLRLVYSLYSPLRKLRKAKKVRNKLRYTKHALVSAFNAAHNLMPTFYLRNKFLRLLGMEIGNDSYLLKGAVLYSTGNLIIGDNVVINRCCLLDNRDKIDIGNNVSISHNSKIYTGSHDVNSPFFDYVSKPVTIGDNVIVFSNVIILPGTYVEDNVVISAGSVVSGRLETGWLYSGNPAKKVKKLSSNKMYKLNYPFWRAL